MRTARLLRLTVLALLLLSAVWGVAFWSSGRQALAVLGAFSILLVHVPALMLETLLFSWINRGHPEVPPASLWQRLQALVAEALLMPLVFYGRQAFRHDAVPDMLRGPAGTQQRGVVLVHGFHCNRAFWNPWMRRLKARGIPFVAVDLDPPFDSIDRYALPIEAAVATLERSTGLAPVLVAHSMGGLAARAWLRAMDGDGRVQRVITIGTPHRGTWLTRLSLTRGPRQMAIDSEWLQALRRDESPARYAAFTCFWSHCDNVVFPASTAMLPGADNRHVDGAAHVQMICREAVFDEMLRWLDAPARREDRCA
ncbi:esterase/lipase family protein [Caldimonas tepidiphila]|uniref:esterase/lipase family protein n=1 Tax=Caldimonas tepidiphila TaxID=2315841 RepID=UPI000E5B2E02|nr:alpha/beta fold hydrolase [Caldimonas tepidiphila]